MSGRPTTGRQIAVRIPQELLDWYDDWASRHNATRPRMIREAMDSYRQTLIRRDKREQGGNES